MEQIVLPLTQGKHRFKGRLLAATRNEANVRSNFGLFRQVTQHRLYQQADKSFLLYEETMTVGGGRVGQILLLETINDVIRQLPERAANHIVNQFIDAMAKA